MPRPPQVTQLCDRVAGPARNKLASCYPRPPRQSALGLLADFVPCDRGLKASRAALYEYMGIAWYLLTGRITVGDLSL